MATQHRYFTYTLLVVNGAGYPPDAHIQANFPRLVFTGGIAKAPHDGRMMGRVTYDDQQVNADMLAAALTSVSAWGAVVRTQAQAAAYLRVCMPDHTVVENPDGTISFTKNP